MLLFPKLSIRSLIRRLKHRQGWHAPRCRESSRSKLPMWCTTTISSMACLPVPCSCRVAWLWACSPGGRCEPHGSELFCRLTSVRKLKFFTAIILTKNFRGRPLGGRAAPARVALWRPRNLFWQFLRCLLIGCRVREEKAGKKHVHEEFWRNSHKSS